MIEEPHKRCEIIKCQNRLDYKSYTYIVTATTHQHVSI